MDKYISKNSNVKLVAYECGNKLIMDMESMIFKDDDKFIVSDRAKPDQIWSIPQMEKTNLDYYKFINMINCFLLQLLFNQRTCDMCGVVNP